MQPVWDYIHSFPPEEIARKADDLNRSDIVVMGKAINGATLGASGAVFGCLAAFGYLFPNSLIYVYFLIPVKAKWFVILYGALELSLAIRNSAAIALLLGWKGISVFFGMHMPASFTAQKAKGSIRIATWNVARFIEMKRNNNKGSQVRLKMMELIKQQDADIFCMQEFFHSNDSAWYPNIQYIRNNLGYPYFIYSHDNDGDNHFIGNIIFSRYPIVDSGMIRYPRPTLPESLMHADIEAEGDTIRVYTTHLQSLQFQKSDYEKIDKIKEGDDGM
ncbi:hypothetical protein OSTOST_14363, partial [Ostertagia ostertagi]